MKAVATYLAYADNIENALTPVSLAKKLKRLQSLVDQAEGIFNSLSEREKPLFRKAVGPSIPDIVKRNPSGPLNNPDYFMDYVLNELRKFSSRLSAHFGDLPVEQEKGDTQQDRKTATFKKPFDVLISEMIPIAEELALPIAARKDGDGVSDFVALVAESLRAYSEAHTNTDCETIAAHYSTQYEKAGHDAETIAQLEEIWRRSYEFGRKTLQKHSHTDAAITEAVSRALDRRKG